MSYEQDLLDDFGSGLDLDHEQNDVQGLEGDEEHIDGSSSNKNGHIIDNNGVSILESLVKNPLQHQQQLNQLGYGTIINPVDHLKIPSLIPLINTKLESFSEEQSDFLQLISYSDFENDEYKFLLQVNQIITLTNYELEFLVRFITEGYSKVFPELASIVLNPFDYIKVVKLIKQDLGNIKNYEQQLRQILPNDKLLVVMMSGVKTLQEMNDSIMNYDVIENSCDTVTVLESFLHKLSGFIQGKLLKFTPNLSNLLGSITTAQLLMNAGSLNQLCLIPSCNVPSLGVKELSTTTGPNHTKSVQKGYLYQNELIKYLPPNIMKSAIRILSGKVILAARIDLSKTTPTGDLGTQYRQQVLEKIDKLLAPPESTAVKPLPKPSEYKSKRRGGKKLQKTKARFRASELAQAQNQMAFGNKEDTFTNAFGEEVGLGMVKNSSHLSVNTNTNAVVSKSMKNRLDVPNEKANHLDSALGDFESIFKDSKKASTNSGTNSKWISSGMKRKHPSPDS